MRYFVHLCATFSLFVIGEYSLLLVVQAAFLTTFFQKKQLLYLFYIPILFFGFLKLFASSVYLLYFFNLCFLFYFLYKNQLLLSLKELAVFTLYMYMLYAMFRAFDGDIYSLYLESGIEDKVHHVFGEVAVILALLHIFIFVILGYNKQKLFRK